MTYRPAPETLDAIIDSLGHLPTFDVEEFHGFLGVSPLLPTSEKAAAWRTKAAQHLEATERLAAEAETRIQAGLPEVARALMDGAQIRLAAAKWCERIGIGYAVLHARYSQ